ncbi:MAG TPA: 16S rRNA (cytidine(1402)-2'-O)-methyltransferase [Candidatus Wildermuthbacteria bacterium]|nr:16S rRNA (cytidine(1402)-2'-O)-methyltransferase [Candidatus Wildermuthbacteria bacterium]
MVATPIGNLEDVTLRSLRILKEVDLILSEDTRVTSRLLARHDITTPLESYHHHSSESKLNKILSLLKEDKDIALVSDAGTPGVSDPGNKLVEAVSEELPDVAIVPIPGPSAITALVSVAGIPTDSFLFLGFMPQKKRSKFFEKIINSSDPVIFFESPHRVQKTLGELSEKDKDLHVVIGRELTKKFEEIMRGPLDAVAKNLQNKEVKGEFVILIFRKK